MVDVRSGARARALMRRQGHVFDAFCLPRPRTVETRRSAALRAIESLRCAGIRPAGSMARCTARARIDAVNAAKFPGYSDWRRSKIEPIGAEYLFTWGTSCCRVATLVGIGAICLRRCRRRQLSHQARKVDFSPCLADAIVRDAVNDNCRERHLRPARR